MRHALFLLIAVAGLCGCVYSMHDDWPRQCPTHQTKLRGDTVRIVYGLPGAEIREEWRRFPYAYNDAPGGCCIYPDSPKLARVKYCSDCRRELAQWRKNAAGRG